MAGPKGSKYYDVFLDYSIFLSREESKELVLTHEQFQVLLLIEEFGSLTAAAKKMDISYRKAWELVRQSELKLGFTLIDKSRGGRDGGHSTLNPDGKLLVDAYRQLRDEFDESVKRVVKKFFQTINK